jgi:hypothetical protein
MIENEYRITHAADTRHPKVIFCTSPAIPALISYLLPLRSRQAQLVLEDHDHSLIPVTKMLNALRALARQSRDAW